MPISRNTRLSPEYLSLHSKWWGARIWAGRYRAKNDRSEQQLGKLEQEIAKLKQQLAAAERRPRSGVFKIKPRPHLKFRPPPEASMHRRKKLPVSELATRRNVSAAKPLS